MTDEEIRELMLGAVGRPDPDDAARVLAGVKAKLAARDAQRAAEATSESPVESPAEGPVESAPEATIESLAPVRPIPLPRRRVHPALLMGPVAFVGLMMAAMVLVAVAWMLFKYGGASDAGLDGPPGPPDHFTGEE